MIESCTSLIEYFVVHGQFLCWDCWPPLAFLRKDHHYHHQYHRWWGAHRKVGKLWKESAKVHFNVICYFVSLWKATLCSRIRKGFSSSMVIYWFILSSSLFLNCTYFFKVKLGNLNQSAGNLSKGMGPTGKISGETLSCYDSIPLCLDAPGPNPRKTKSYCKRQTMIFMFSEIFDNFCGVNLGMVW